MREGERNGMGGGREGKGRSRREGREGMWPPNVESWIRQLVQGFFFPNTTINIKNVMNITV